jgi:predicted transposase YbfD/YdcC
VETTPEESGLCGCWQFIVVWRERQKLRKGKVIENSQEYSFYASSLAKDERSAQELADLIRGHWGACEMGSHYRRDVSLGEDASHISGRPAAFAMATLRNLVLGLFELQKRDGKANADFIPGWRRRMTLTRAIGILTQGG